MGAFRSFVCVMGLAWGASAHAAADSTTFCKQIELILNQQVEDTLLSVVDTGRLYAKITRRLDIDGGLGKGIKSGVKQGIPTMINKTAASLKENQSTAKCLDPENSNASLVRIDIPDGGFEYIDFSFTPDKKIDDWFLYTKGETVSNSMRRMLSLAVIQKPGVFGRLLDIKTLDKRYSEMIQEYSKAMTERNYEKAYQLLTALPDDMRRKRLILSMMVDVAAMSGNDDHYRNALSLLAERFKDDSSMSFALIDHYVYEEDLDSALKMTQQTQKRIGPEGGLKLIEGNLYRAQGQNADAVATYLEAIDVEPDYSGPYWPLLEIYIETEKFDEATMVMEEVATRFDSYLSKETLKTFGPAYIKYADSKSYNNWIEQYQ